MNVQPLILASTSPYRHELLSRLRIPFETVSPDVDETPFENESAKNTSWRLSREKAQAVAKQFPDALIIGSDQVVLFGEQQLGKPLSHENAVQQLKLLRGQTVVFYTALTLLNARTENIQTEVAEIRVQYRNISDTQIENYLNKEQPYNCAGCFKSEGLGIAILSSIKGDDPNALIGLPLILLVEMLQKEKYAVL